MSDETRLTRFGPPGIEGFLARYYERRPAVLRVAPEQVRDLISSPRLLAAIADLDETHGTIRLDRDRLRQDLEPLPALEEYLREGFPILWSAARGVWPEVDALASEVARAFGAQVCPNVYSTGSSGSPFAMHFHAHEVLAVQCEGTKEWTLSGTETFVVAPGDVIYIPRGQFHRARALEGRSLHVTFGIEPLVLS